MAGEREEILIVDDEDSIRKLVSRKLSAEGYRCQEAANAEQALDRLTRKPASLVLLDIKMPGKSGIELLAEIKPNSTIPSSSWPPQPPRLKSPSIV